MFMRNYGWKANNIVYITESSQSQPDATALPFSK